MFSPLVEKFEKNLLGRNLLKPNEKIFVACSGGPDSVALFHLLKTLEPRWKFKIALLHFNHGLRGKTAAGDEKFVRELAKRFKTVCYTGHGKILGLSKKEKFSIEEAARAARYAFFREISKRKKVRKILTGHTLNDQAETVLMRVFQGTGLRGLCAIRETLQWDKVTYVRPLLTVSRPEIMDYLKKNKIKFRKDKSNDSARFLRNRIRSRFLPQLQKEINPRILEALARIPESLGQEAEALSFWEAKAWKECRPRFQKGTVIFGRDSFSKLPQAVQFRLVERGLKTIDSRSGIDFNHWKRVSPLLSGRRGRASLPKDIELVLTPSQLMLCKKA